MDARRPAGRDGESGWRPLRSPSGRGSPLAPSPFSRLAATHALSAAGDALLTVALANSLFFGITPDAAKGRVALYLALTMAPFAVVAPLLGPVLDRSRGGRRLVVVGTTAIRCVLCLLMASDLDSYALFPEAFAFLVMSKSYAITKSALVPGAVEGDEELVEANSKLQLVSVAASLAAGIPGGAILQLLDGEWVLRLAGLVFAGATVAALRLHRATAPPAPELDALERAELRRAGVVLAAGAMGLLRGTVGFLTFLVAFGFRNDGAPSWWFGIVLMASMGGTLSGAVLAPQVRRRFAEERILTGVLGAVAVAGLLLAWPDSARVSAALLAATLGAAASTGKLAFDSIVQRDAPDAARGRSFARFETRFQLLWVAGAFVPVVAPIPLRVGFLIVAAIAVFAAVSYAGGLRAAHVGPRRTAREVPPA